ncbi:MAG: ParM/StbA family protein [Leptolyngbya sp. Prado105]|jgi:hypothetical protein|nr:ParM/StbA family protein [Leptolyngbya sp. Prado105]
MTASQPDIILTIDTGTSQSKVFWKRWSQGTTELLLMGSEFLEISPSDLMDTGLSGGRPENDAFIELDNGKAYVLGMKAQQMRGKPPTGLSKYEFAAYKALAIIGAIAETANLPEQFTIALSALLPYKEYQDRKAFHDLLSINLAGFNFRGRRYYVSPLVLEVKPEGAGLAQSRRNDAPQSFNHKNILVTMIGQRDASLLPFKQGTPQSGHGIRLGFEQLIEAIATRASLNLDAKDAGRLTEYIFQAQQNPDRLDRIARMVVTEAEIGRKVEQLQDAIAQSRSRYLRDLLDWMQSTLGQDLYEFDEAIVSGGAALYFKDELENFFAQYDLEVSWATNLQDQIHQSLTAPIDPVLACRVSDAFGVFKLLGGKVSRLTEEMSIAR